jgi:peptidyl-tRNA hydrolase, PTH1 family
MKIVVGLGNPGKQYEKTRHNAGFTLVDKIRKAYKFPDFSLNKKFSAEMSRDKTELTKDKDIVLFKPQLFMNNSGKPVKAVMDFYKLTPENLVVIHDDIDIEIGKYKISSDSGSAGHNGVWDIIDKIGAQNFKRIRIGVANEKIRAQIDPSDFVLQQFSDEELSIINNEVSRNVLFEIGKLI